MTVRNAADVGIFSIGGRVITSRLLRITDRPADTAIEITGLSQADDYHQALGKKMYSVEVEGWYDDAAGSVQEALELVGEQVLVYAAFGNVRGRRCIGATLLRRPVDTQPREGDFHRMQASYVSNEYEPGVLVQPLGDVSDGEILTAYDNGGAASNLGGSAYLTVPSATMGGFTSVTVKLQHSSGGVTFADLITFSNITAGPATERMALGATATVNRYLRAQVDFNGTGANESIKVALSFSRGR